jgi:hypothetical protein
MFRFKQPSSGSDTCGSTFNVNFNVFLEYLNVHSLDKIKIEIIKMRGATVKKKNYLSNIWAVPLLQTGRHSHLMKETRVKSQVNSFQIRDA